MFIFLVIRGPGEIHRRARTWLRAMDRGTGPDHCLRGGG
jgi:hypothetical protein